MRTELPDDIDVRVRVSRFFSTGLWRRVADLVLARFNQADVFHVTGDVHFLTYLLPRRRTVLTVLDCGLGHAQGLKGAVYRWLWLRIPVMRAGTVVAISDATADELALLTGRARERIGVVPVSVDEDYVEVPRPWPEGAPIVLCVGTTPNKNLERTADALSGLDVDVRIIGEVDDALRSRLDSSGVTWQSEAGLDRPAMRREYEECDLVCFASTYEGFGMPIVEANAVGRPVVTSGKPPMDWVAADAACLVDPDDTESIRAGIRRVLGDSQYRAELVAAGFVNRERFRPAAAAAAYAGLYRSIGSRATRKRKKRVS